jgi:acyl transferase domain-containing protein
MSDDLHSDDTPFIAVIGMAGRFPGAQDVDTFWRELCCGTEAISPLPELADPDQPDFVPAYGVLDGADEFDAEFFGYAPNEALIIDPQQRLFLECAHEALERAGYGAVAGRRSVGVFAGGSTTDYRAVLQEQLHRLPFVDEWQLRLVTGPDFLATRTAYKLGLDGPAVSVQTACSTSLVAVHLAMQALLAGDCRMALAGGAAVHVPHPRISYTEGGIIAPDGHCRAFDAAAQGTVGGSAIGVVVLKPLADALADGDHVHAVLLGSAVNNDGAEKIGFTAPSVAGQARAIRAAHVVAGVDADSITYVEAHGTGTRLGDPIEVAALTRAFRDSTDRRGYCALGSVKTNIGHTDAAAGVTGLIKTVLAAEHGVLPPSLHFRRPNPEIDFGGSPFVVNDALREWRPAGVPRRAGVSALGVGGTNAHVVVEEPPARDEPAPSRPWQLLVLSARTPTALNALTRRHGGHLRDNPGINLADVAWTLQVGREAHRYRQFVVGANPAEASAVLLGEAADDGPTTATADAAALADPEIVFMFPGQGSQHVNMARELYEHEPVFRAHVDECALAAQPVLGLDLRTVLFPPHGDERAARWAKERLDTIEVGQPAVFIVEYALARQLATWGITPGAVVGHSLGAYAAACVAGVLPAPDAARLVARRGQLLQSLPRGAMVAIRLPEAEVARMLPASLSVAAVNGPRQCTVAGHVDRVIAFADELVARDVEARVLSIATAGHSTLVEPILDEFRRLVDGLDLRSASVPFLSDTTGTWAGAGPLTTSGYWATHLRAPVQFGRALSTVLSVPNRILVEVGPGRTLVTLAWQHPDFGLHVAVQTLPHPVETTSDLTTVLAAVGQLWAAGTEIRWEHLHSAQRRHRVVLPTYPFERKRYLVCAPERVRHPDPTPASGPDGGTDGVILGSAARTAGGAAEGTEAAGELAASQLVEAAGGEVEQALGAAFAQSLGLERIGVHDDFFQLGGDSLAATKVAAWGRRRFGVPLTAVDIIRARTVAASARMVEQRRGSSVPSVTP